MKISTKTLLSFGLALGIVLCFPACDNKTPAVPPPSVEVQLAWDGFVKAPGWTEATITLTTAANSWSGQVRITDSVQLLSYEEDVVLGANGHTTLRVPMYIRQMTRPTLELLTGNTVVFSQKLELSSQTTGDLCAAIGERALTPETVPTGCKIMLGYDSWPAISTNPLVWESLDRLYITSALSAERAPVQQHHQVLETWASQGGQLFLFGESAISQFASLSWLNFTLEGATVSHTDILASDPDIMILESLNSATLEIGRDVSIETLVESAQGILALRQTYGWGQVYAAGWTMPSLPGNSFSLNHDESLAQRPVFTGANEGGGLRGYMIESIFQIKSSKSLPPALLVILMLLYAGVIGPGILLLTRHYKKPLLAWLLIPSWITLGLIIASLVLQGTLMKAYPVTGEMAILEYALGAKNAKATQLLAIFAPRAQSVTWHTPASGRPLLGRYQNNYWYDEGTPFPVTIAPQGTADQGASYTVNKPVGVLTWAADDYIVMPELKVDLYTTQTDLSYVDITGNFTSELALANLFLLYPDGNYAIQIADEVPAGVTTPVDERAPIIVNEYASGYFDYCTVNLNSMVWAKPAYPGIPATASGSGYVSYAIPDTGTCHLVATVDGLPLLAQDITPATGSTCLLIALPCPTEP